ncbi:uncharacterized protein [Miscanthus floridulus]|uniref:uncharacterized protein n=1 Tax=Miscanthus floridulus TaxID=154761 RepID=UPI00345A82E7
MHSLIQQHLSHAQTGMKCQADKHRSERQFAIGDWVFLKLQLYVQSSLAKRANQKLSFRFFGSYKILDKIGAVAYRLQLPPSSSIHAVFHISQLKASHGQQVVTDVLLDELVPFQVPQAILDRRLSTGDPPAAEVLIQWSRMPPSLATWELLVPLKQRFPRAPAWGHAGSKGEGIIFTAVIFQKIIGRKKKNNRMTAQ